MSECYLCLAGPSARRAPGYGFDVCENCWRQSVDGWDPAFEPAIFNALSRASLLIPDRTDRGRLPRAYAPPADYSL